ncbi:MAG: Clp protease N-terminal domain-containing protein [Candidatus Obscuribacterales bacterium]
MTANTSLSLLESMSRAEARRLGAATVRTSHVLLALAGHEQFQANTLLNNAGIDQGKVRSRMKTGKNLSEKSDIPLDKEVKRLFKMAESQALALGQEAFADLHVVLILMSDNAFAKDPARRILNDLLSASFCRTISDTLAGLDVSSRVGSRQESLAEKPSVYSFFDEDARAVMDLAFSVARKELKPVHLVVGLARHDHGPAYEALSRADFSQDLQALTDERFPRLAPASPGKVALSSEVKTILESARNFASSMGRAKLDSGDLLLAILDLERAGEEPPLLGVLADRRYMTLDGLRSHLLGESELELVVRPNEIPDANYSLIAVPVTGRLLSTLHTAREDARAMGHSLVTEVHLAMALLLDAKEKSVLTDGDRGDLIFADLLDLVSSPRVSEVEPEFSPDLAELFQRACFFVPADHGGGVDINHIAMAIANQKIVNIMTRHGLTPGVVRRRMQWCLDWTLRFMPDEIKAADTISMSDFSASLALALKPLEKEEPPLTRFFGPRTETLLDFALREAQDQGDDYVGIDHLFIGILSGYSGQAGKIFEEEGVDVCLARECLGESRPRGKGRKTPTLLPSVAVSRIMRIALDLCRTYGFRFIEPEHIAYALACEHEGLSLRIFDGLNIDGARVTSRLESVLSR